MHPPEHSAPDEATRIEPRLDDTSRSDPPTPASSDRPDQATCVETASSDSSAELAAEGLTELAQRSLSLRLRASLEDSKGARLGRYTLLRVLGEGAMGVVFAAYDEELDRKIAIKLLRTPGIDRSWLLNEAKAMARVNHPNIVQIYDVGEVDAQFFIAMEFIVGTSLYDWLREAPRTWEAKIEACVQAGHGLAAAHRANLIHCDFKPQNVMVGEDGRVRVLDFGLALMRGNTGSEHDPSPELSARSGLLVGTPVYMAPEIYLGGETNALSDQFAFCVSLYYALFERLPFSGSDFKAVAKAICEHQLTPPPSDSPVPTRLRRAVTRGLSHAPEERWPSMDALLAELQRDEGQRWRRIALVSGTAIAAAGLGLGLGLTRTPEACPTPASAAASVWSPEARARVETALLDTGLPFAEASAATALTKLDDYAAGWGELRAEACEDHQAGLVSDRVLGLQERCLSERASSLAATVAVLSSADAEIAQNTVEMVEALRSLEPCADRAGLLAAEDGAIPAPTELEGPIRDAEARLATASALRQAGRYDQCWTELDALRSEDRLRDWPPLVARIELDAADTKLLLGDFTPAEDALWAALAAAERGRAGSLQAEVAMSLTQLELERERFDVAGRWLGFATALAEAASTPGEDGRVGEHAAHLAELEGRVAYGRADYETAYSRYEAARVAYGDRILAVAEMTRAMGQTERKRGNYAEALALYARARATYVDLLGSEHPQVALVHEVIGGLHQARGNYEDALREFRKSLEIRERSLPAEHPDTATALSNCATSLLQLGQLDEAQTKLEAALAIREAQLGPEHQRVGDTLYNLGAIHWMREAYAEAEAAFSRAHEINLAARGPDHPDLAYDFDALATLARDRGDDELALERHSQAVAHTQRVLGPEHPDLADWLSNRGQTLLRLDRLDEARSDFERARTLYAAAEVNARRRVAPVLGLTRIALAEGKGAEASAFAEQALALSEAPEAAGARGEAQWLLARALDMAGQDEARARELASATLEQLRAGEESPDVLEQIAEIEGWLAHRAP